MSTAERAHPETLPPLENGQLLDQPTFHQRYETMPDGTRAELVGGVVYMPSPMRLDHGSWSRIIAGWLDNYARLTPRVGGADGATVKLDLRGEPQPDCVLYIPAERGGQSREDDAGYLSGAPELVVEIARSSRHFDLGKKKADYQRAGVIEYVVVELAPNRIHWFMRRGDRFVNLPPGEDGIHRSQVFPGLSLDGEALYAQHRNRLYRTLRRGARTPEHAAFVSYLGTNRGKKRRPN
jgi:Uma2 family endonuclease